MTSRDREIERKYEVAAGTALPDLGQLPKVVAVNAVLRSSWEAIHSDTADLALADAGITLLRRTGGSDAGWHLKLPHGGDDRSELAEPLKDDDEGVPPELLDHIRAWVRDRELRPVATVSTRRVVHQLIGDDHKVLAEVSDDRISARAAVRKGEVVVSAWREWQIELVGGSRKLLRAADEMFLDGGANASGWLSTLHHALDRQPAPRPTVVAELTDKSTAGAVVSAYLGTQVTVILSRDHGVRHSEPDAVHQVRVATRRMRSALSTFRPLFDREITDPVREELRWFATALGAARDAEVQRMYLLSAVADEPDDLVLGAVAGRVEVELRSVYRAAHDRLLEVMASPRYFRLLDRLEHVVSVPPFTELAAGRARKVLTKRVRRACKHLHALVSGGQPEVGEARDAWLHDIRKAGKRVRYAAEVAEPVLGKVAGTLVTAAEDLQEILGAHQDSVVTRSTLREIGVRMHLDGENPFTIGRLHALQQARADAAEVEFARVWSTRVADQLRAWPRR